MKAYVLPLACLFFGFWFGILGYAIFDYWNASIYLRLPVSAAVGSISTFLCVWGALRIYQRICSMPKT